MGLRWLGVAFSCAACGLGVVGVDAVGVQSTPDGGGGLTVEEAGTSIDAGLDAEASTPVEASAPEDAPPITIAPAGTVAAPTGFAQQTHLFYAETGHRWWLFTIASSAASSLQAWSSTDFKTWSPAADLTLPRPHKGQGSNFSVAYATIGTHDVVHLGIGLAGTGNVRTHYHARAELTGATISWSAVSDVSTVDDLLLDDPEGCATVISAGGRVTDFTGWSAFSAAGTGNQNAFVSLAVDNGGSWTSGFGTHIDIATVPQTVNARAALSLGGESLLAIWESADDEPDPGNLRSEAFVAGAWTAPLSVFSNTVAFGVDDWGATALTANDVHAIRRTPTFEHRRYDGTSWQPGAPIPAVPRDAPKKNTGLVVLHDAAGVELVCLAGDSSIQMTRWSGGTWSAWKELAPAAANRTSLSGWSSPSAGIGLIWTEADNGTMRVAGLLTHSN